MSLFSILSLGSCAQQGSHYDEAHIVSFSYHFDGTIGGNSLWYEVRVEDGKGTISVEEFEHHDYGTMTDTVSMDFVQALEELCKKHNVYKYNGFDKYNKHICDGSGFSLYVKYDNGKTINAHGMNEFPKGYRDFAREMEELFEPYCVRLRAAALEKKKTEGVSGEMTFILMLFHQQGTFGSDKYEVMLSRSNIRDYNVDVKVHSTSGEFFPEGDYRYYCKVEDGVIDWKGFAEIVKKHELVKWMDWQQYVKDSNNNEWFQMALSFEEGHIDAIGTAHPEHYDAFRKDFLKLLYETVKDLPTDEGEIYW